MPKLLAIVGGLIICAGVDLLWQSRWQVRYWFEVYLNFFTALWRRQLPTRALLSTRAFFKRQAALPVLLGLGFVFFLGPLLLVVSLTLMLTPP
jgi:hypothetical protein